MLVMDANTTFTLQSITMIQPLQSVIIMEWSATGELSLVGVGCHRRAYFNLDFITDIVKLVQITPTLLLLTHQDSHKCFNRVDHSAMLH